MSKQLKILLPLLFALAVALGLLQYHQNLFGSKTTISHFAGQSADSLEGYYQKSQALSQSQKQNQAATFLAAGDIMLSRNVAVAIQTDCQVEKTCLNLPFLGMADILKSTNFNFANLESPIAPKQPIVGGHTMVFAAPKNYLQGLKDYNFGILNLANNHSFDQGLAGIDATKKALDDLGISHEGTGDNLDEAWMPAVVTANNIKICFVGASYASANDGGKTTNNYVARMEDVVHLKSAIIQARLECDFVVVTMHGGIEYTRTPNKTQTNFAHAAIDDGADIIIGAHPHWVQTIEKYNGRWIFYSLGNFIFDQNFSVDTKEGLTLKVTISKNVAQAPGLPNGAGQGPALQGPQTPAQLQSIELLPVVIDNSQPRPATAEETKKILQKIGKTETILK